jgi:hypothetical protein
VGCPEPLPVDQVVLPPRRILVGWVGFPLLFDRPPSWNSAAPVSCVTIHPLRWLNGRTITRILIATASTVVPGGEDSYGHRQVGLFGRDQSSWPRQGICARVVSIEDNSSRARSASNASQHPSWTRPGYQQYAPCVPRVDRRLPLTIVIGAYLLAGPEMWARLGVPTLDPPLLDLRNVTSGWDCARGAIDVLRDNPLTRGTAR